MSTRTVGVAGGRGQQKTAVERRFVVVPEVGLEPSRFSTADFESAASTDSATTA